MRLLSFLFFFLLGINSFFGSNNDEASSTIETSVIKESGLEVPSSITAYTQSTVIITSDDAEVIKATTVTVVDDNNERDGVLKILAIGNSFSEDALEYYLHGLAKAANEEIVIGNLYIGGAELSQHVANATANENSYSYRKIGVSGNKTATNNVSIATALADENWDYISFQQVSQNSGVYSTFVEDLPALYEYVNSRVQQDVKYLLHQTWAYAGNSTHSGFANYNNDQQTMYEAIVDAYNQAEDLLPTFKIVPAGTAIQNARTSYLGDNFTSDGYHLNEIGRYTAASAWFEILFDKSVVGNTYRPAAFTPIDIEIAQHAAHEAVQSPNEVTVLTDYQNAGGSGVITEIVKINFGNASTTAGWNTLSSFLEGTTVPNLTYGNGEFTGIELSVTSRFNGINANGETTTNTSMNLPSDVSGNSFFGNSKATWAGMIIEKGVIKLSGFEGNNTYDLCFFGSRTATDNRETQYTVIGETTASSSINTASNTNDLACVTGIKPDSNGVITIEVTSGPNNNNANGFFYLNAMTIKPQ